MKARNKATKGKPIRSFVMPKQNFAASNYTEMIDRSICNLKKIYILTLA